MEKAVYQPVVTGQDPRSFESFTIIRAEINKLNHPLHPVIDWRLLQHHAITLFTENGVDLQSVVYYSMARTQLNEWQGFAEGCELLAVLIVSEWESFWPPKTPVRARNEIIDWFAARVGTLVRTLPKNNACLRDIYRAEYAINRICEKLSTIEEVNITLLQSLHFHLKETIRYIQPTDNVPVNNTVPPRTLPLVYLPGATDSRPAASTKQSDNAQKVFTDTSCLKSASVTAPEKRYRWLFAAAGALTGSLLMLLGLTLSTRFEQQGIIAQVMESARFAPSVMDPGEAKAHRDEFIPHETLITEAYQQKLDSLLSQSAIEPLQRGQQMAALLQGVYPTNRVSQSWQNQLNHLARMGVAPGYEQARFMLQTLMAELLSNEKQHRTVTISYLKSAIYDIQQRLAEVEPVSYQLSAIEQSLKNGKSPSPAQLQKISDQLKGLQARYLLLMLTLQPEGNSLSNQDERK